MIGALATIFLEACGELGGCMDTICADAVAEAIYSFRCVYPLQHNLLVCKQFLQHFAFYHQILLQRLHMTLAIIHEARESEERQEPSTDNFWRKYACFRIFTIKHSQNVHSYLV